jgi:hypothetical protein
MWGTGSEKCTFFCITFGKWGIENINLEIYSYTEILDNQITKSAGDENWLALGLDVLSVPKSRILAL